MRIVKGRFAGRDLVSPNDARVRPTAEHVRAALLDELEPRLAGARVLDLFAGTGALGLEAISRGSASADFVETRPSSLHALRANVALFRLRDRTRIFKRDALPFAGALGEDAYDIVFADPPYGSRMLDRVLDDWRARRTVSHAEATAGISEATLLPRDRRRARGRPRPAASRSPSRVRRHGGRDLSTLTPSSCSAVRSTSLPGPRCSSNTPTRS